VARSPFFVAGIVIPGVLWAAPVQASDSPSLPSGQVLREGGERNREESPSGAPFAGAAIANDSELAVVTGKADIRSLQQAANATNTSTVSGNIINGDPVTGAISIDGAAFGGLNGLAIVNANTGNNVSINAAMNVNVSIQQ
jgi:hypothetical protein